MRRITKRKVFNRHLSEEELARSKTEDEVFGQRCREIFNRVYPELVKEHYGWAIIIEPESGDYFIAPEPEVAFAQAKEKHPTRAGSCKF